MKNLQYVLSTVELFLVLFLLSWLLRWTDLLVLFFVRVASHWLRSALTSALDSVKYIRCKGPAALSSPSSIAKKKRRPDVVVSCRHVMHVVSNILPGRDRRPQIDIPKRYRKLTFVSVTDTFVRTYVHSKNRSLTQSLALMRLTIKTGFVQFYQSAYSV